MRGGAAGRTRQRRRDGETKRRRGGRSEPRPGGSGKDSAGSACEKGFAHERPLALAHCLRAVAQGGRCQRVAHRFQTGTTALVAVSRLGLSMNLSKAGGRLRRFRLGAVTERKESRLAHSGDGSVRGTDLGIRQGPGCQPGRADRVRRAVGRCAGQQSTRGVSRTPVVEVTERPTRGSAATSHGFRSAAWVSLPGSVPGRFASARRSAGVKMLPHNA